MIKTLSVKEYDLIVNGYDSLLVDGFYCVRSCSECNGTREITGHKHWCSWNKKKAVKDE